MAVESRIGPIELHFQAADHKIVMTMAESERILQRFYAAAMVDDEAILRRSYATTTQTVEGVTVPAWIALEITGGADPDMRMRVEIRDNVAVVTEVTWTSQPHQNPIRPKHLHQVNLDRMVTDLLASAMGVKQEVAQEFTQKIASGDDREILGGRHLLSKKAKAASRQLAELAPAPPRVSRPHTRVPAGGRRHLPRTHRRQANQGGGAGVQHRTPAGQHLRPACPCGGLSVQDHPRKEAGMRQQLPPQIKKIGVADRSTGKKVTRYQVTVDAGHDPETGRRRQIRRRFATEAAARTELAKIQGGVSTGTYVHSSAMTVDQACEAWLASKHALKPSTLRGHRSKLATLRHELGHIEVQKLR